MSKSILAVDAEVHMLHLLERIITEKTRYKITATHNALEVPGILAKEKFDLILSELEMPGFSGIDILKKIREEGRSEEVIIITAFGSIDNAMESFRNGAFDFVVKPVKKERLFDAIEGAMNKQDGKRDANNFLQSMQHDPFLRVIDKLKIEYIHSLILGMGKDAEKISKYTGISLDESKEILKML